MIKQIPGIVAYPFDAQSSPFLCALASVLLPALGYTEESKRAPKNPGFRQ